MSETKKKRIDMLLILPAGLLLLEVIIVVVLLAAGYEIKQSFTCYPRVDEMLIIWPPASWNIIKIGTVYEVSSQKSKP